MRYTVTQASLHTSTHINRPRGIIQRAETYARAYTRVPQALHIALQRQDRPRMAKIVMYHATRTHAHPRAGTRAISHRHAGRIRRGRASFYSRLTAPAYISRGVVSRPSLFLSFLCPPRFRSFFRARALGWDFFRGCATAHVIRLSREILPRESSSLLSVRFSFPFSSIDLLHANDECEIQSR